MNVKWLKDVLLAGQLLSFGRRKMRAGGASSLFGSTQSSEGLARAQKWPPAPRHRVIWSSPPSLHLAVNLRWCQSVCQSRQCPLRGNPLPPHPKKSDIVQLWECLVWRQRGVSGRNSVRPDEAASSLALCSCDRSTKVWVIKVLRHAPPCLLSILLLHNKAAPGHHDPLAHLLPLPHHGTRGYA